MGVAKDQNSSDGYQYDLPESSRAPARSRKRKAPNGDATIPLTDNVIDLTGDTPPKKRTKAPPAEEKRLRKWRSHAPGAYYTVRDRALGQRMFVLDRQRDISNPDVPTEIVLLAGTTGNVYTITIDRSPSCDCPHALKGNQCKHIIYVLARVLRVPFNLEYQLAFLYSELKDIFARAPPLPSETADESKKDGNRKALEGECPICCVDFEPENTNEEVVYCKASCGNNVHKECFKQWAATKRGGEVSCPFCRAPWQQDRDQTLLKDIAASGRLNEDGYLNIAGQLGLSGKRDYSSYHGPWVRRTFGND